ncbi:predicted protein [Plenodomus lingam JN3]|uniref:Predicted protein n=1 Tax=Leptosphaeria maculans (strain JN3 / isolate v23.1.3 / race Av1-4-5-6-7-8) TaxID=985895 RepID=E5R4G1_LEPMJ|nr:predicted protein [Plenodomus lingam JN3]CBX91929.1 predicted protein [Plenodomus lingam JN3]
MIVASQSLGRHSLCLLQLLLLLYLRYKAFIHLGIA